MNLVIDVGNTLIKIAVFKNRNLVFKKVCIKNELLETLKDLSDKYPDISKCIVSSVVHLTNYQLNRLRKNYSLLELNHETSAPFQNNYSTPKTLGVDRIALVSAAAKHYPKKNVLIIDAGSCITYDFLNNKNEYLGGAISPGIGIRYNSLHTFTAKLPLLDANMPKKLIGDSTASSIHLGVIHGILYEMDGFIDAYKNKYDDLTIILTGGDAHFLRDSLKNDIFANSNFLLEGLHYILEHNID